MGFIKKLFPSDYYKSIFDIPLDKLRQNGINGLVFDIDNTLAPYFCKEPDDKTITFISDAKKSGFSICLLSNNSKNRVTVYNRKLKVFAIHRANKPSRRGLLKAMSLMKTNKSNTVIIGDQIFTDVWCGNRAGVRSILIKPHSEKDQLITKIKRGIEKKIIAKYLESRDKV